MGRTGRGVREWREGSGDWRKVEEGDMEGIESGGKEGEREEKVEEGEM